MININKINNLLSPQIIEHKRDHNIMLMETKLIDWDRHTQVTGLNG